MDKEKRDWELHLMGLGGLIFLAVFFGLLEVLYSKEIVNLEMIIVMIGTIVAPHAAQRLNQAISQIRQGQNDASAK